MTKKNPTGNVGSKYFLTINNYDRISDALIAQFDAPIDLFLLLLFYLAGVIIIFL